jgi:hypothetical protein
MMGKLGVCGGCLSLGHIKTASAGRYLRQVVLWQPAVQPGVKGELSPQVLLHAKSAEV